MDDWCPKRGRVIVDLIKRLDLHGDHKVSKETFAEHGQRISALLRRVKDRHGMDAMHFILANASRELGHTPGPINSDVLKMLVQSGATISRVHRALRK